MISSLSHREAAKKEIIKLIKNFKNNKIMTDNQIEQSIDTILYHITKATFNKVAKTGVFEGVDLPKESKLPEKKNETEFQMPQFSANDLNIYD